MHKAKNCIITCIDFRLQDDYHRWIASHKMLSNSDIISVAGCSRDIAKPIQQSDREFLLSEIETSVKLHNPENIILLDHQDCGKYAEDSLIPSGTPKEEDLKEHRRWVHEAIKILARHYPDKKFSAYYFSLSGKVEEI